MADKNKVISALDDMEMPAPGGDEEMMSPDKEGMDLTEASMDDLFAELEARASEAEMEQIEALRQSMTGEDDDDLFTEADDEMDDEDMEEDAEDEDDFDMDAM